MDSADERLEALKAKMTDEQRRDMASVIANELKRRESLKAQGAAKVMPRTAHKSSVKASTLSSGMPTEHLGEVYSEMGDKVRQARIAALEKKIERARRSEARMRRGFPSFNFSFGKALFIFAIVLLAGSKILLSSGLVSASTIKSVTSPISAISSDSVQIAGEPVKSDSTKGEPVKSEQLKADTAQPTIDAPSNRRPREVQQLSSNEAEKQILVELDRRRVELDTRKTQLEKRETELALQSQAVAERIAELRGLVSQVGDLKKERDHVKESRLEQLSSVYGAMAPNEAAPLFQKLDNEISLALLERLPGKRVGQILALMDNDRAIELTKLLSLNKTAE
jgi:flagellar motility protein MotE (MotC chaperone)